MGFDLKSCPFCGAFNAIIHTESLGTWIECLNCGAQGPFVYGDTNATKAWNTRAVETYDARAAELYSAMVAEKEADCD